MASITAHQTNQEFQRAHRDSPMPNTDGKLPDARDSISPGSSPAHRVSHPAMLSAQDWKLHADQGNAVPQFNYGICLEISNGVSIDLKRAAYYSKLAADRGLAVAQINYGICLGNGKGVSIHWKEAIRSYKLAADQENALAQINYGICLRNGEDVSIHWKEARSHNRVLECVFISPA
jgi:hypothetical protein